MTYVSLPDHKLRYTSICRNELTGGMEAGVRHNRNLLCGSFVYK